MVRAGWDRDWLGTGFSMYLGSSMDTIRSVCRWFPLSPVLGTGSACWDGGDGVESRQVQFLLLL